MHKSEIMPRPALPPTPASSTDIAPKHPPNLSNLELLFTLPPPAIANGPSGRRQVGGGVGSIFLENGVDSSMSRQKQQKASYPPSPPSPQNTAHGSSIASSYPPIAPMPAPDMSSPGQRKRLSAVNHVQKRKEREDDDGEEDLTSKQQKSTVNGGPKSTTNSKVTLPPPPGRSRKIIQMKPKAVEAGLEIDTDNVSITAKPKSSTIGRKKVAQSPSTAIQPQLAPSPPPAPPAKPTAATRKTARKTAHSLIERRRRFKMNEEFGVLKSMIPACAGVEMHKLAILQASIEYLKYLEECVERLKKGEGIDAEEEMLARTQKRFKVLNDEDEDDDERRMEGEDDEEDQDAEMNNVVHGATGLRVEAGHMDDSGNQMPKAPMSASGGFTFVHHQMSSPQIHSHQQYPKGSSSVPPQQIQTQFHQTPYHSPSVHGHDNTPISSGKLSEFIPTTTIPAQLLPPPALPIYTATTYKMGSSLEHPPQTIELHHHHHHHHHHKHPVPAFAPPSSSHPSPSPHLLPKGYGGDVDREATHALLLLAGEADRDNRRKPSIGNHGGASTPHGSVPQSPADGVKARTLSVMDMLSS